MTDTRKMDLPLQCRLAPIGAVNAEARTAELIFTTGARVKRYDYMRGRWYMEELSTDPKHVRLERLNSGAPLLDSHNRFALDAVLGVVEPGSAKVDGKRGTATVRFSQREEVEPIFRDVKDKIITGVSCGYVVSRFEELPPDDESEGLPIYRAVDYEIFELSLVAIGADAGATVRSNDQRTYPCIFVRGNDMSTTEERDIAQETAKPSGAELYRVRQINQLVTHHGLGAELARSLIETGATVAETRARVIEALAQRSESIETRAGFGNPGDWESPASRISAMGEALAHRYGIGRELSEPAKQFAYVTVGEMMRAQLDMHGINTKGFPKWKVVDRYFEMLGRAPSHSAADFANLFGDVAQRSLRQGYMSYTGGLKRIARKRNAADFRTLHRIQFGEAPTLNKVEPGGEITQGSIAESVETYALATYARIFGINRQAVVNDDLGALTTLGEKWGRAAAEREASCFIDLLAANSGAGPTMSDGNALFGTAHANYSTGAASGTIDTTTLGAGVAKLRLMKGIDGITPIDCTPAFLIVPAAKETQALQATAALTPQQISNVNPHSGLTVITDPRLDGGVTNGTAGWYLAADPAQIDTIEYAYLEGQEGVYLESRLGFEIDGLEFKARLDFACAALDHRGLFKSSGS